jgi:hypothetical protein
VRSKLAAAAAILIGIAIVRIVATYPVLNHTMDEPSHIACGMEWLQQHSYNYMPEQPPLSRGPMALGALLAGAHNVSPQDFATKNPLVLYDSPSYWRTLSFARAFELPFFVLGALVVVLWGYNLYGTIPAILALLLYTMTPPVLGHAGLATTDTAPAAMTLAATYALVLWLKKPSWARTILLGFAIGAGILSKFTFLLFFPVCAAVVVALRLDRSAFHVSAAVRRFGLLASALVLACFTVWAGYWFRITPVPTHDAPAGLIWRLPEPLLSKVQAKPVIFLPAGELVRGLVDANTHNFNGHNAYLFGHFSRQGWWYFFPVVLAYKTPLAFLVFAILSCVWLVRSPREHWTPLACAAALLVAVMPTHINLGIRHILPIYGLLAIPAGFAAARMLESRNRLLITLAGALLAWNMVSSVSSHPDYIAYFNELAGRHPEKVRVDSDLDWGQDVSRLAAWLDKHGVHDEIAFAGFGCTDPHRHGLHFHFASPWEPSRGWLAISTTEMMLPWETPPPGNHVKAWSWLDRYQPVGRISGGAILVYNIPGDESASPATASK